MSCKPRADGKPYKEQITYVTDRPGHDRRYAIDARKIERSNWAGSRPRPSRPASAKRCSGTWTTREWVDNVLSGGYRDWVEQAIRRRQGCGMKVLLFGPRRPGGLGAATLFERVGRSGGAGL